LDNNTYSSVNGTEDYVNFLPNLTIQHSFSDKFIVNAAYTNTIARPDYFDLTPYRVVVREDEEIEEGNPGLEPTESVNFDLTAEYYFSSVGLISAGFSTKAFPISLTDILPTIIPMKDNQAGDIDKREMEGRPLSMELN
jgi:outer membrane receptor protein involved in Fe transport